MLVQHMGEVPDTLPVTEEARERLREQANQLGAPTVLRLIDLLARRGRGHAPGRRSAAAARAGAREGDAAGSDLSRESLAYRLELLEQGGGHGHTGLRPLRPAGSTVPSSPCPGRVPKRRRAPRLQSLRARIRARAPPPPDLELEELQEAWRRSVLPAVEQRSIPAASMLVEARIRPRSKARR